MKISDTKKNRKIIEEAKIQMVRVTANYFFKGDFTKSC